MTTLPISRAELAAHVINLPDQIEAAEAAVLDAAEQVREAREALVLAECSVDLSGCTNDTARRRELRAATPMQRARVQQAEEAQDRAQATLRCLRDRLSAYRAAARLIGGAE